MAADKDFSIARFKEETSQSFENPHILRQRHEAIAIRKDRSEIPVEISIVPFCIDPNEFYSGCYGRASITLYPYDTSGSKGIAAGLNNVQKLEDGEKFGGTTSAAADFAV